MCYGHSNFDSEIPLVHGVIGRHYHWLYIYWHWLCIERKKEDSSSVTSFKFWIWNSIGSWSDWQALPLNINYKSTDIGYACKERKKIVHNPMLDIPVWLILSILNLLISSCLMPTWVPIASSLYTSIPRYLSKYSLPTLISMTCLNLTSLMRWHKNLGFDRSQWWGLPCHLPLYLFLFHVDWARCSWPCIQCWWHVVSVREGESPQCGINR